MCLSFPSLRLCPKTAFTYQGRLNDGGNAANGVYDFQFAIYDAGTNGNQIGNFLTNSATSVTNGLFTVMIDFGNVFAGGSNWLDIAVRTNGGASFTALLPRQQLTPAPSAVFANTASNLNGTLPATQLTGTLPIELLPSTVALVNSNLNFSGINTFNNNVGIGAPPGSIPFYIRDTRAAAFPTAKVEANSTLGTWLSLLNDSVGGRNWNLISSGSGNGEGPGKYLFNDQSSSATRMVISTDGNVGIGTVNPSNTLSVAGSAGISGNVALNSSLNVAGPATFSGVNTFSNFLGIGAPPGNYPLYVRDTRASAIPSVQVEANSTIGTWLTLQNDSVGGHAWNVISTGSANGEGPGKMMFRDQTVFANRLVLSSDGNVGVGVDSPQAKLQVAGDIIVDGKVLTGSGGTNYAASSTEYLRIVRGSINGDGSIARGSGFTAVQNGPIGTGSYTITFTPAFSGTPSVTATAVNVAARAGGTINASTVTVSTINFNTSAPVDDSFSFIAIGPY